jgi:(heptosyl)LPS beta-1,4-glucosyltransferase
MKVSTVIICKNEAHIIGRTIAAAKKCCDDIVIVDSGSTDDTLLIARQHHCTIIETEWKGYGITKNIGIAAAKNDWILSIDADEVIDETLSSEIIALNHLNPETVFNVQFKVYFNEQRIRFGEWSTDAHIRLFNKNTCKWTDAAVHEVLVLPPNVQVTSIKGHILHYTATNEADMMAKAKRYAQLNATKYFEKGKRTNAAMPTLAATFSFIKNYFFRFGFLDGKAGFIIAKINAHYTWLKYQLLLKMQA